VVMPNSKESNTLCVSSQIGCPYACDFCATGKMGFLRNLSISEILHQIYVGLKDYGISNIVFMGMGEPLLNPVIYDVIERTISPQYFDMSSRGLTLSTVGVADQIIKMAKYKQVTVAWSYHSGFEEKRQEIFPVLSRKFSFEEILSAFLKYQDITNKRITIEYLLIKDFNDNIEEANKLKEIGKQLHFHLNIIPYNPHPYSDYQKPDQRKMEKFLSHFSNMPFEVTIRKSKGSDIQGACGQLAFKRKA
jgi:23S rRNA (adenine2503-C2)-methyltransferase